MFFLSKTLDHFLLPPGLFVVLGIIGAALLLRRRGSGVRSGRVAGVLIAVSAALLWLLSIEPVSRALMSPLEAPFVERTSDLAGAEAIVVLGGGTVFPPGRPDGLLTAEPRSRAAMGAVLHHNSGLPVVYTGGTVFNRGRPEAEMAVGFLSDLGVSRGKISAETESRNTWENASNVKSAYGFDRVVLVTSGFHLRRAVYSFEGNGIEVIPAASNFMSSDLPLILQSFLPDHHHLYTSTTALHEYIGMVYYRIRYRRD